MPSKLTLTLSRIDHQSVRLEWNKPNDVQEPLFRLDMNENDQNWTIIYRGFHNYYEVNYLSGGCTYNFKLCIESNNKKTEDSVSSVTTFSCSTKNNCPSITAFHQSLYQNLPLIFREFLDTRPKDINIYNELGECGLSKACAAGHNDLVLTLLQNRADVNSHNKFTKITPLMIAAYHGHCNVIRILAHNDANASLKDINLKTALHHAVDGSQNNAVIMLLNDKWSDINSVDSKGWTPIMRAVLMCTSLDVVKTLLDHGSDLSIKDKNGQNVWQLAHLSDNWKALKLLPD